MDFDSPELEECQTCDSMSLIIDVGSSRTRSGCREIGAKPVAYTRITSSSSQDLMASEASSEEYLMRSVPV